MNTGYCMDRRFFKEVIIKKLIDQSQYLPAFLPVCFFRSISDHPIISMSWAELVFLYEMSGLTPLKALLLTMLLIRFVIVFFLRNIQFKELCQNILIFHQPTFYAGFIKFFSGVRTMLTLYKLKKSMNLCWKVRVMF